MTTTTTTLSAKRLAPGLYTATINKIVYLIKNVGGVVPGYSGWVWHVEGEPAHDVHSTKRAALEALADWTKASA